MCESQLWNDFLLFLFSWSVMPTTVAFNFPLAWLTFRQPSSGLESLRAFALENFFLPAPLRYVF